jgi:hypothetical protein
MVMFLDWKMRRFDQIFKLIWNDCMIALGISDICCCKDTSMMWSAAGVVV